MAIILTDELREKLSKYFPQEQQDKFKKIKTARKSFFGRLANNFNEIDSYIESNFLEIYKKIDDAELKQALKNITDQATVTAIDDFEYKQGLFNNLNLLTKTKITAENAHDLLKQIDEDLYFIQDEPNIEDIQEYRSGIVKFIRALHSLGEQAKKLKDFDYASLNLEELAKKEQEIMKLLTEFDTHREYIKKDKGLADAGASLENIIRNDIPNAIEAINAKKIATESIEALGKSAMEKALDTDKKTSEVRLKIDELLAANQKPAKDNVLKKINELEQCKKILAEIPYKYQNQEIDAKIIYLKNKLYQLELAEHEDVLSSASTMFEEADREVAQHDVKKTAEIPDDISEASVKSEKNLEQKFNEISGLTEDQIKRLKTIVGNKKNDIFERLYAAAFLVTETNKDSYVKNINLFLKTRTIEDIQLNYTYFLQKNYKPIVSSENEVFFEQLLAKPENKEDLIHANIYGLLNQAIKFNISKTEKKEKQQKIDLLKTFKDNNVFENFKGQAFYEDLNKIARIEAQTIKPTSTKDFHKNKVQPNKEDKKGHPPLRFK